MLLTSNDLLHCNNLVPLSDVSLELYREFSESVLMKRLFHYYFSDNTEIIVSFNEKGIRHLLAIQHIDNSIPVEGFFQEIKNGLSFSSLKNNYSKKQRFKNFKERIRLFSCVYNSLRIAQVFYLPNGEVPNTKNVHMNYLVYRIIDGKGFSVGIKIDDPSSNDKDYLAWTILVAKANNADEHIRGDDVEKKLVNRLTITNTDTNEIIEDIYYSNNFIMSSE